MVLGYSYLRIRCQRLGWKPLRDVALRNLRPHQFENTGVEMVHIICAACKSVIGILESEENLEHDAGLIAQAHYDSCTATEAEKEQAIYDVQFKSLTKDFNE